MVERKDFAGKFLLLGSLLQNLSDESLYSHLRDIYGQFYGNFSEGRSYSCADN